MLKLWDLAPSPNNTKVRMALRFKGIEFETIPVDPADRAKVIELSGQEATPVIEAKGVVLNDSEAILQFLDANYRDTPRLFPGDKAGRRSCGEWDDLVKGKLVPGWGGVFFWTIGRRDEMDDTAKASYLEGLRWLEGELGDASSFRGDDQPICDLRVATWTTYALPGDGFLARVPLVRKFADAVGADPATLPNLVRFLAPWNERLA